MSPGVGESWWDRWVRWVKPAAFRERGRWGSDLDISPSDLASEATFRTVSRLGAQAGRGVESSSLGRWLARRAVRDVALDRVRRSVRRRALKKGWLLGSPDGIRARLVDEESAKEERARILHDVLECLRRTDPEAWAVARGRLELGLSPSAVAFRLGMSRATEHRRWVRARTLLREAMDGAPCDDGR